MFLNVFVQLISESLRRTTESGRKRGASLPQRQWHGRHMVTQKGRGVEVRGTFLPGLSDSWFVGSSTTCSPEKRQAYSLLEGQPPALSEPHTELKSTHSHRITVHCLRDERR